MHNIKFAILPVFMLRFSGIKHFHAVVQPSPITHAQNFRTFPDWNPPY